MAAFRREAAKQQRTVRLVVVTALAAFAAVVKVDAQSAPGDFELWGVPTGPTSLEVVVFVPEQKNGSLDKCFGTLSGPDIERNFTCDDHGGKSSTQTFKHLQPETEYNCTVTFANLLPDGQVAGTTKSISLKTQAEPPHPDPSPPTGTNPTETAAGMIFLQTPVTVILSTSTLLLVWHRHLGGDIMGRRTG